MSKREWKPGDVALDPNYGPVFVVRYGAGCRPSHEGRGVHTHLADGDWNGLPDRLRPLVVIDPEDREQVERLWTRYQNINIYRTGGTVGDMQAALREFANPTPPKPEEPTGLGAVVEDADARRWVRVAVKAGVSAPWAALGMVSARSLWASYADIDVMEVLSEGVTE